MKRALKALFVLILLVFTIQTSITLIAKWQNKNERIGFLCKNWISLVIPTSFYDVDKVLENSSFYEEEEIYDRVNYYNRLSIPFPLPEKAVSLKEFQKEQKSLYFFDLFTYFRYFSHNDRLFYEFGDVNFICQEPAIVKSRPISEENINSVLLNLDKLRHFNFVNDRREYHEKKDLLVWRGAAYKKQRVDFINQFLDEPLCNIANTAKNEEGRKVQKNAYLSINQQLEYKFILSLEGADVATNLKWILSSNSLCFAPKPKFETWFMEGRLIPNYHYVEIRDDFSDLIEKIEYYIAHEEEALKIINHAHAFVNQFQDPKKEKFISLLVLKKYFSLATPF